MTEAWILADKQLLKQQIGTTLSDTELNLNKDPESISNPKQAIENAIRIARQNIVKRRRRNLGIGELYAPLGQLINSEKYSDIKHGIKFTTGNIGINNNIITFPYFCIFLLKRYMDKQDIFK